MTQWVRIGGVSEMPAEGMVKGYDALGLSICIARIDGQLAALNNECPHHGAPLSDGAVEDGRVVCSWHRWSFDPKTGAELRNPLGATTVYPLRIDGEDVLCEV
jgi:nitrite reductase/ring-hydroxylating ferredoxin subunit